MKKSTLLKYLEFAAHCDLKAKDYKVLLYLLSDLLTMEKIMINQNTTAEELGLTKSDVSKALRRLEKNKILYFDWLSERKKSIGLVEHDDDELDELIAEKIEEKVSLLDEWEY
ncbi:hypothetical protein E6C60_4158 [Paenibacillus algicola]|uniref:Uncharacterized protein n=1 Tax=Paenibacillus algicola TaxID=2565926 RepID=A0A4P8XQQ8_9BACL|nr:LysR family transcriptional regulator [Paenibacillus algicola]QCT04863.1 hypothetical protein E6C60_4158 [Paenibacillus algicola]